MYVCNKPLAVYRQQQVRLYRTVKLLQFTFHFNHCGVIKLRNSLINLVKEIGRIDLKVKK
jgi:hypothetical protein